MHRLVAINSFVVILLNKVIVDHLRNASTLNINVNLINANTHPSNFADHSQAVEVAIIHRILVVQVAAMEVDVATEVDVAMEVGMDTTIGTHPNATRTTTLLKTIIAKTTKLAALIAALK